jgi:hypothetical protein
MLTSCYAERHAPGEKKTDKPNDESTHDQVSRATGAVFLRTRRSHVSCQESVVAQAAIFAILSNYLQDNLKTRIPIESIPDHSPPLRYNMVETRPKVSSSWNRPKNQLVAKHQM